MKLGVCLEAFRAPFRTAIARAAKLNIAGAQCDAVGDLAPSRLSATGRREILHLLRSHDLALTALVCPLRRGLDDPTDLDARLDRVRQTMSLSYELGARIVIVETSGGAAGPEGDRELRLAESLANLGRHGDRIGATLALHSGRESGAELNQLLDRFDTSALGVNFDPAYWLLHGFDPLAEVQAVQRQIVHVHAKDARRRSAAHAGGAVALGHGDLDWLQIMGTLSALDYRGWVVLERAGIQSEADVATGIGLLRRLAP